MVDAEELRSSLQACLIEYCERHPDAYQPGEQLHLVARDIESDDTLSEVREHLSQLVAEGLLKENGTSYVVAASALPPRGRAFRSPPPRRPTSGSAASAAGTTQQFAAPAAAPGRPARVRGGFCSRLSVFLFRFASLGGICKWAWEQGYTPTAGGLRRIRHAANEARLAVLDLRALWDALPAVWPMPPASPTPPPEEAPTPPAEEARSQRPPRPVHAEQSPPPTTTATPSQDTAPPPTATTPPPSTTATRPRTPKERSAQPPSQPKPEKKRAAPRRFDARTVLRCMLSWSIGSSDAGWKALEASSDIDGDGTHSEAELLLLGREALPATWEDGGAEAIDAILQACLLEYVE